jgi:hypothetical protein
MTGEALMRDHLESTIVIKGLEVNVNEVGSNLLEMGNERGFNWKKYDEKIKLLEGAVVKTMSCCEDYELD